MVLSAGMDGLPGWRSARSDDAPADDAKPWAVERRKSLNDWPTNYLAFIEGSRGNRFICGHPASPGAEGAIVIGVSTGKHAEAEDSLDELQRLARTAGLQVLDDFSSVAASRTTSM